MAPLHRVSSLLKGSFGLVLLLGLAACGGSGGDGPGAGGSESTGVLLSATIMPTYLGTNTPSVDVIQQVCTVGPPPVFEKFTDHGATATITATLLDPATPTPGTLFIEKYTVEFRRSTDSIGAPPMQSDTRFDVITIVPSTSTTATVAMVDLLRKDKYRSDIASGIYTSNPPNILNNYTAIYTFEGQNQFGFRFKFQTQTNFQIGSFDYCT